MKKIYLIDTDGSLSFIYSDEDRDLLDQGEATITRVSNVEPTVDGMWQATMQDGVQLPPCKYREDALKLEVDYINRNLLK